MRDKKYERKKLQIGKDLNDMLAFLLHISTRPSAFLSVRWIWSMLFKNPKDNNYLLNFFSNVHILDCITVLNVFPKRILPFLIP